MEQQKTTQYKFKDAGQIFLSAILMPQIVSLIFILTLSSIAASFQIEYTIVLDHIVVQIVSLFIIQIGFLAIFFLHAKIKNIDFIKATRFTKKISIKEGIILAVIAVVSLFLFSPLINFIDYLISLTGYSASGELPIDLTTLGGFVVGILSLAVAPAICEELIFRGIIYSGLEHKLGYKKAIVMSALLFALMHTSIQQTAYQIIIGLMLGYAFYLTGSLLAPIILHFSNNFIIVVLNAVLSQDTTVVEETVKPFSTVDEYVTLFYMTAIGVLVVWQLFELLKHTAQKKVVIKPNNEQLIEENAEILVNENNETSNNANLTKNIDAFNTTCMVENIETIEMVEQQENVSPENIALQEFMLEQTKQIEQKEQKAARKLLTIGIIMGILFWLFDFIFYLS